jgi:hypothetical protein
MKLFANKVVKEFSQLSPGVAVREDAHQSAGVSPAGGRSYPFRFQLLFLPNHYGVTTHTRMQCQTRDAIEQHLSDLRILASRLHLTQNEKEAVLRAERFAIGLLREHDSAGHGGSRCPLAPEF